MIAVAAPAATGPDTEGVMGTRVGTCRLPDAVVEIVPPGFTTCAFPVSTRAAGAAAELPLLNCHLQFAILFVLGDCMGMNPPETITVPIPLTVALSGSASMTGNCHS